MFVCLDAGVESVYEWEGKVCREQISANLSALFFDLNLISMSTIDNDSTNFSEL